MKSLLSLLFTLWAYAIALGQPLPAPVAHYPFDGNALDISGNGNHGTPVGATLTTDRFGTPNSAYFFDGADDYMTLTNNANFQPPLPVTVTVWVAFAGFQTQMIFNNDYLENNYQGVYMAGHGARLSCSYTDGGDIAPDHRRTKSSNYTMSLGQWYHLAVVIRAANDMDLYVNGRNVCGTYSGTGGPLTYTGTDGAMGISDGNSLPGNPLNYFYGRLDDLRFYDQALTVQQIRAIMGSYDPVALDTTVCQGDPFQLQAATASSYQWTPATGLSCTTCPNPTVTPNDSLTYTLATLDALNCPDTAYYLVNPVPCCTEFEWDSLATTDVSCAGQQDGALFGLVTGGTPPYTYSLDGGPPQPMGNFAGLAPGTYLLSVADDSLCSLDTLLTITEPQPLVNTVGVFDVVCFGEDNGNLQSTPSGGTPPYQYALNGGPFQGNADFFNLAPGSYALTLRDNNGCLWDTSLLIAEPAPLDVTWTTNSVSCFGLSDGSVQVIPSGGANSYLFSLDGGPFQSSPTFSGLAADTFALTVRDTNFCFLDTQIVVSQPTPLTLSVVLDSASCDSATDGSIQGIGAGGTLSYQFSLDNDPLQNGGLFDSLLPGSYDLTLQDANGCAADTTVAIGAPPTLLATANVTDVACHGNSTGSIALTAMGGTAPYQFALDGAPWQSADSFPLLPVGSYLLSVRDTNLCRWDSSIAVNQPAPLLLSVSVDSVICHGDSSGAIQAAASGGTAPYQFAFDGGPWQSGGTFTNLPIGTYALSLRDANLCQVDTILSIEEPLPLQPGVDPVASWQRPRCFGDSNGVLTFTPSGGIAPYQLTFDGANSPFQIDSLPSGNYHYLLTDANGCIVQDTFDLAQPDQLVLLVDSVQPIDCFGNQTGSVFSTATGGNVPGDYQFFLDSLSRANGQFDSLFVSFYTLMVVDSLGCADSAEVQITGPDSLFSQVAQVEAPLCYGDSNGRITILTTGGTAPYQYATDSVSFAPDNPLTGFPLGSYWISTQDANDCLVHIPVNVPQPDSLVASVVQVANAVCAGDSNGRVTLRGTGGVLPYQFSADGIDFQSDSIVGGYPDGQFFGYVQDANGCRAEVPVSIGTQSFIAVQAEALSDFGGFAIRCHGDSSGMALALADSGQAPYQYRWSSGANQDTAANLTAGTYTVIATDSLGCTDTTSLTLTEPDTLGGLPTVTSDFNGFAISCANGADGQAEIAATGGVAPYQYQWPDGQNGALADNLSAGTYAVRITDANGCPFATDSVTLTEPEPLRISGDTTAPSCIGSQDGRIAVDAQGGVGPYQYLWQPESPYAATNAELREGTYALTLRDANQCEAQAEWTLNDSPPIELALTDSAPADCHQLNGRLSVQASAGNGEPYQYQWLGGPAQPQWNELDSGRYAVQVRDTLGCADTFALRVGFIPGPEAEAEVGFPDASRPILVSQADVQFLNLSEAAVAYEWDLGVDGQSSFAVAPSYQYTEPGAYQVILTAWDADYRCPDRDTVYLEIISDGRLYVPNVFTPNNDGQNDHFEVIGEGIVSVQLVIYSRWGMEIWQGQGTPLTWDGRSLNGEPVPEGTYAYVLRATLNDGRVIEKGGTVMVLR